MKTLAFLLLLAAGLQARDVTIAWDANPADDYITAYGVQYKAGAAAEWGAPVFVTAPDVNSPYDVPTELNFPQFPNTLCYVRAFARNAAGDGPPSVELVVPVLPGQLKGFRFRIERKTAQLSFEHKGKGLMAIQQSTDLKYWWNIATGTEGVIGTAVDTSLWERSFFRGVIYRTRT